ncbi:hypothetical protein BSKO_06627 [Bryopsis sp. KO-2023]|nr:hypothetical protein BSKO_06627 [Bryopsis sp. KO-2023]
MPGVVSRKGAWLALLSLATFAVVTTECYQQCRAAGSCDASETKKKDSGYTVVKLPGIDDFGHGLDYSTGERKKTIFRFTYSAAKAGAPEFLHDSHNDKLTYLIPDQVDAMNWAALCASFSNLKSTSHHTFRSYQESQSKSIHAAYDQKTDISASVPVGGAEVSMSTQTRNNLGYGSSSGSSEFASAMTSGQRTVASATTFNARWAVQWRTFDENLDPIDPNTSENMPFLQACKRDFTSL